MTINTLYPAVNPTLNLDFSNTKTLDPRITFGRASSALAYDGKTTVLAEQNFFIYSQAFSNWTQSAMVTTDNVAVAPDGNTTASKLVGSAANALHAAYQMRTDPVAGNSYTVSVYAKAAEYSKLYISDVGLGRCGQLFDLANGTVSTTIVGVSASIAPAGNGWYRCTVTFLNFAGNTYIAFAGVPNSGYSLAGTGATYTGDATSGIYLWGAQLEQRAYATAYTPTTTAAITNYIPALQSYAANVARFDFNPTTGESLGLMVEEQRTNLATYSQDFDNPAWIPSGCTAIGNVAIAPDGTLTADKIFDGSTANAVRDLEQAITRVANTTYTFSVYLKAAEYTACDIAMTDQISGQVYVTVNLSAGTVGAASATGNWSAASAAIQSVGNGWYRASITGTSGTGTLLRPRVGSNIVVSRVGVPTSGFLAWGAQLEAGAFATSYIPTLLTYSGRGSTGTYIGDNGLIQTAAANVARYQRNSAGAVQLLLEGASANIYSYTSDFSQTSIWTQYKSSVRPNRAIAPDGTYTADLWSEDTSTNTHELVGNSLSNSTAYVFSIYVKAAGRTAFTLSIGGQQAIFDLSAVTATLATGAGTPAITAAQNGWYRCSFVFTSTTTGGPDFYMRNAGSGVYAGDGISGLYMWGVQLETGSTLTSYIPSTETFTSRSSTATYFDPSGVMRTAPAGLARYDFDPVTGLSKGLLVEAAASNLLLQSANFATTWVADGVTVSSNAVVPPDGSATCNKLSNSVAAIGYISQAITGTNTPYVGSFYAKAGDAATVQAFLIDSGGPVAGTNCTFDLSAGTTVGGIITPVGNGWYRCSVAGTPAAGALAFRIVNYTNTINVGFYIWGAQLETGSVATSYIPTTSAQVTRAADSASSVANSRAADVWSSAQATRSLDLAVMSGSNFSSWYRNSEGTFYTDAMSVATSGQTAYYVASNTSGSDLNFLRLSAGNVIYSGTVQQVSFTNYTTSALTQLKSASVYKANDFALYNNGSQINTSSTGQVPIAPTQLGIGNNPIAQNVALNGWIKRLAYFPKRLSNTELQGLTS